VAQTIQNRDEAVNSAVIPSQIALRANLGPYQQEAILCKDLLCKDY